MGRERCSCFFIDEEHGSDHFHESKLGYRVDDNGNEYFMRDFLDRYGTLIIWGFILLNTRAWSRV